METFAVVRYKSPKASSVSWLHHPDDCLRHLFKAIPFTLHLCQTTPFLDHEMRRIHPGSANTNCGKPWNCWTSLQTTQKGKESALRNCYQAVISVEPHRSLLSIKGATVLFGSLAEKRGDRVEEKSPPRKVSDLQVEITKGWRVLNPFGHGRTFADSGKTTQDTECICTLEAQVSFWLISCWHRVDNRQQCRSQWNCASCFICRKVQEIQFLFPIRGAFPAGDGIPVATAECN